MSPEVIVVVLVLVMVGLSAHFSDGRWEISIANHISATRWQQSYQIMVSLLCRWRMFSVLLILFMTTALNLHTHTHEHVSIILTQLELNKYHQAIKMPKLHQFLLFCRRNRTSLSFIFAYWRDLLCKKHERFAPSHRSCHHLSPFPLSSWSF